MASTTAAAALDASVSAGAATLCEAFAATAREWADSPALRAAGGDVVLTWGEYAARVRAVAGGLAALGVGAGDTVALMLTNRPEAHVADTATMQLGAIPFSIYNTSSPEQVAHLLAVSRCRVAVTERLFADRILAARPRALEHVVVVDAPAGTLDLGTIEREGDPGFDLESAAGAVRPDAVATLIYTSGTTGPPKGVELTHRSILCDLRLFLDAFDIGPGGRYVSYLPMAHIADRMIGHYPAMLTGACVTSVADLATIFAVLPELRPTMFVGVPRIWEKLRASILARHPEVLTDPDEAALAAIRLEVGLDAAGMLGSGAAPIAPEVLDFFWRLGLRVHEGWGMSECMTITCNRPGECRAGTVGRPLPGVEVICATDGELLVRGPIVMRGYREDPVRTAETIDADGWLHSGDVGAIDEDGYVRIADRKKELIINASGKNMSPVAIETALKAACPLIGVAVAIGDRRPYTTALVVLEPEATAAFAAAHGIPARSLAELAADERVRAEVAAGIERGNARLSRVEQVRRHTVLGELWLPGGVELTPTMKLRRRAIAERHAAVIDAMYDEAAREPR
jgi:long-chain acyl-CoA synthetase